MKQFLLTAFLFVALAVTNATAQVSLYNPSIEFLYMVDDSTGLHTQGLLEAKLIMYAPTDHKATYREVCPGAEAKSKTVYNIVIRNPITQKYEQHAVIVDKCIIPQLK